MNIITRNPNPDDHLPPLLERLEARQPEFTPPAEARSDAAVERFAVVVDGWEDAA